MKLFKVLFVKITLVVLLLVNTLSARAANDDSYSEYAHIGSEIIKSVNNLATYVGGIKAALEHESFKQVLVEITTLQVGKIGTIISLFLNNSTYWNWFITEGDLPENVNATTQVNSGIAVTTLDYNKLKDATNLSVARTMLHEMIHSYLTLYFQYDGINAKKEYPEVLEAWQASNNPDYNEIQHTEIEKNFVYDIAESLSEYGQNVGLISVDSSIYRDLSWGGLDFESNNLLTQTDKNRIQDRINAEQLSIQFDTQSPVGTQLVSVSNEVLERQ
ncbi:MAG TPA: hypothetical protein VK369_14620 [Segetibacter sp.]|nr:hypothetical protein [Segetibacter sp.]